MPNRDSITSDQSIQSGRGQSKSIVSEFSITSSIYSEDGSRASFDSHASHDEKAHHYLVSGERTIDPEDYGRMEIKKNRWDLICSIIAASLIVGILSLILEMIAHSQDGEWNKILLGDTEFPKIGGGHTYFDDLVFNLQAHPRIDASIRDEMSATRENLMRGSNLEVMAMIFIGVVLVLVLLSLAAYVQGEGSRTILMVLHAGGCIFILAASILILLSDMSVDTNHKDSADRIRTYMDKVEGQKDLSSFNNSVNLGIFEDDFEVFETLKEQLQVLINIENLCSLGASKSGRYGGSFAKHEITIEGKAYTLSDLQNLKFCSFAGFKFAAFVTSMIYFLICLAVPFIIVFVDKIKGRVGPEQRPAAISAAGDASKGAPQKNADGTYDPRFNPVPPSSDLALVDLEGKPLDK